MAQEPNDMAVARDTGNNRLLKRLLTQGYEFDFFQAVWLIERFLGERTPVGMRGPIREEGLRFRPGVSVAFPATDVHSINLDRDKDTSGEQFRMDVTFMGLYGTGSPLPTHYPMDILREVDKATGTATARKEGHAGAPDPIEEERLSRASTPTRDFLDLIHHRLISLFYRAWIKYRYEKQFALPGRDTMTGYLLWMVGCPSVFGARSYGVPPLRLLRYAGVWTQQLKSADLLGGVLSDYWMGLPVDIEQCVGSWTPIPMDDLNSIGTANCALGVDMNMGEQIFDMNSTFNVALGPVDWNTFQFFLPDGLGFAETRSLIRLYCTDPLSFTIEVKLLPGEVPEMRLTSDTQAGRLGFTSWLCTGDLPETSVSFDASSPPPLEVNPDRAENADWMDAATAAAT